MSDADDQPQLTAAVDMIGRVGATSYQIKFTDDEEPPIVWVAVAEFNRSAFGKGTWEAAAGHTPLQATLRLCEELIDGGTCTKCGRPSGIEPDDTAAMPLDSMICWYQYDPGAKRYVQGCTA